MVDASRAFTAYAQAKASGPGVNWRELQGGLQPGVVDALTRAQAALGFPINLVSGARPNGRPTSQHFHGNAVDISLAGLPDDQRTAVVKALAAAGFNRLGAYSGNTGLHADMKDQRQPNGQPWLMFDRTAANMHMAPAWFRGAFGDGTAYARTPQAPGQGREITISKAAPQAERPATLMETLAGLDTTQKAGLGLGVLGAIASLAMGGSGPVPEGLQAQSPPVAAPPVRLDMPQLAPAEFTLGRAVQSAGFDALPTPQDVMTGGLIGRPQLRRG